MKRLPINPRLGVFILLIGLGLFVFAQARAYQNFSDAGWPPLLDRFSHPEHPAGHPSLNGFTAIVLLIHFDDAETFTLSVTGLPSRTHISIGHARSDSNSGRIWAGVHYPSTVVVTDAMGEAIANYVAVTR